MSITLTRGKITFQYIRDPFAIETIDIARLTEELGEGASDPEPLYWIGRQPVTGYDRVLIASDQRTGRCIGFLGVQDNATDRDETFFHLRAAFVAERARGRRVIRKMLAMLMLRAIGNEEVPAAIAMRTSRAMLFRSMRDLAERMPGITFYPAPTGEPTNLRAADLARRVARQIGHGIRFSAGPGAFRGGLFAAGGSDAAMLAPEMRITGLLGADYAPPDHVLALLDLRGVNEEELEEVSRNIYRRP